MIPGVKHLQAIQWGQRPGLVLELVLEGKLQEQGHIVADLPYTWPHASTAPKALQHHSIFSLQITTAS